MTAPVSLASPILTLATVRRSRRVLVLLHLPMAGFLVLVCLTGLGVDPADPHGVLDAFIAAAIGAVQLILSMRTADARSGTERFALYAAIVVLAAVPVLWVDARWQAVAWFVSASGAMVFTGAARIVAFLAPVLGSAATAIVAQSEYGATLVSFTVAYEIAIFMLGAGCLVGATRVVQVVSELSASRAALADLASRAERQRAGRDLHDTLGQGLSAVSIKGDLALALLTARPDDAAREIAEIAAIAKGAADELDAVALDQQNVSLADEISRAVAFLRTAGVSTDVEDERRGLDPLTDRLFGWAVREAASNLLQHSDATWCRVIRRRVGSMAHLEIVNDGVRRQSGRLGGLAGLAERARALNGTVEAGRVDRDKFRVRVIVPRAGP